MKDVNQCWFADDSAAVGDAKALGVFMARLQEIGPAYGYFPESEKSTVIAAKEDGEMVKQVVGGDVSVKSGSRYLGTFVGDECERDQWVITKVEQWRKELQNLIAVAKREPQAAYCLFTKALSAKWTYIQRVCPGVGHLFQPLEDLITSEFIPVLAWSDTDGVMRDDYRRIFSWSVHEGGAGLRDPIETADRQYGSSVLATSVLVKAIKEKEELSIERHEEECRHVRQRGRTRQAEEDADERRAILDRISGPQARAVERAPKTGRGSQLRPVLSTLLF